MYDCDDKVNEPLVLEILSTSNRVLSMNAGSVVFAEETAKVTAADLNERIVGAIDAAGEGRP